MKFLLTILLCASTIHARTISLNLYNNSGNANDNQLQTAETAGIIPTNGQHWNNIGFANGNISGAQTQRNQPIKDNTGNTNAATFISTLGSAYTGYSGADGSTDDSADLMRSYLSFNQGADTGHLGITDLTNAFTSPGYKVIVYFDTDNANRTHTLTLKPNNSTATTKIGDDSGTYTGTWAEAIGAGTYANHAIFENLTATSFTLEMSSNVGRAAVNGIQIISNDHPLPPEISSLTTSSHYVSPGSSATITWTTKGATTLTLNPGNINLLPLSTEGRGNTAVQVNETTTYTLTAANPQGTTSAKIRVGAGTAKPNILFFIVDDMGWQDTSVPFHHDPSGNPLPSTNQTSGIRKTPNMETLATRGMKFSSAYACSVCTPTRVSIMTGMNASRHHVTTWTHPSIPQDTGSNGIRHLSSPAWRMAGMDASDITLPKLLQNTGYRTIHAGKAHFGTNSSYAGDPTQIGFDVNIAGHGAGGPGSYRGTDNYGTGMWQIPGLESYHGTNTFLSEALTLEMNKAIEQSVADGVPFFAYMAHYAVHVPWQADPRFTANYPGLTGSALAYATLIEGMDKSLGNILAKLETLGVAENTLVIFYSDNGSDAGNPVLRGKKGQYWEGGIRVPLIAAWAKPNPSNKFQTQLNIPAGSLETDIVTCEDMFPTVAKIAGANYTHPIDGHDLTPYFRATPGTHRPQEFIQHFPHGHNHDHFALLRQGNWKIIHQYSNGSTSLYNLADDIGETTNLANAQPEKLMAMTRHLRQRLVQMNAQYSINKNTNQPVPPTIPNLPNVDADNDGIPDLQEDANQNGLIDPGETNPDDNNTDGDNINDGDEAKLGLNPLDSNSFFHLTPFPQSDGTLSLTWPSAPGTTFTLKSSTNLTTWPTTIATNIPASQNDTTTYNLTPNTQNHSFYRITLD